MEMEVSKMNNKTRKISIKFKILIPTSLISALICLIIGAAMYLNFRNGMIDMGVEEAYMAAKVVLHIVDGDKVAQIEPGCQDGDVYKELLEEMRAIQKTCGIKYLYTLYTDGKTVYYGVDADTSDVQSDVGDECETAYEDLSDVFAGEEYIEDFIDVTEYGSTITVYLPIKDSTGKVVAAIGCDYDAENVEQRLGNARTTMIVITLACIISAFIILMLIVNRISRSLRVVDNKIYDIVNNEGDLTQKLDIKSGDELELIADNVNAMIEHIRGIMLNISDNSNTISTSSMSIAKELSEAEVDVTEVSSTMEEMSAAMEETTASINQINELISDIFNSVDTIAAKAEEGKNTSDNIKKKAYAVHENAVVEQENAKKQAMDMSESVNDKIEKSKAVEEIGKLTSDILNISAQTNLLALNASIEAARAGESGRGFAVVADEIGKLATNSAEVASQIQSVSVQVVTAVNELAKEAESMLEFMMDTAITGYQKLLETSENYQSDVDDTSAMLRQFAEASDNLEKNIERIKLAIESVNTAVEESTKGVVNVTETTVNLTTRIAGIGQEASVNKEVAGQLMGEVNKFKLN